jgi:hypothetical protein
MQYSRSIEAHRVQLEKYLIREGTDRDGSRARLYGTDLEEYRQNMAGKNFRIFLSPQSDKADLKALTERFVKRLEMETGLRLYWQAANHYNTAHPHAHLLINGRDRNGKEVEFPRDLVRTFMREHARDLCTAQLGARSRGDLETERERELAAPRYTRLDGRLKELCGGTYRVNLEGARDERERGRLLKRLENLQRLKLCGYSDGGYKLSPRWEESLKANGRYNAFLKARGALRYTSPLRLGLYTGEQGEITGKITKVYRIDGDASDNHAVVLEGLNGKAHFVPLLRRPSAGEGSERQWLRDGDVISLKARENQQGRLTPVMVKRSGSEVRREIAEGGFTGPLARELASGAGREGIKL